MGPTYRLTVTETSVYKSGMNVVGKDKQSCNHSLLLLKDELNKINWWLIVMTVMTRAFVTYVRPLLEYASCVWSPDLLKHIKRIESVQKRFTKRLPNYISFGLHRTA